MLTEAETTTRLEGTQVTKEEFLLQKDEDFEDKRTNITEARGVLNAINEGNTLLKKGLPFSNRVIKSMHEKLMHMALNERGNPGRFRNVNVSIGARYTPPEHVFVEELMKDFDRYINNKDLQISPIVKIAILHAQFEIIHPFADGNGRIGRLIISFLAQKYNLTKDVSFFISSYFEKNRSEYYNSLENITKKNDWEGWVNFFLKSVVEHSEKTIKKLDKIKKLHQDGEFIKLKSKSSHHIRNYIFENPSFDVPKMLRYFEEKDIKIDNVKDIHRILRSTQDLKANSDIYKGRKLHYTCPKILKILKMV